MYPFDSQQRTGLPTKFSRFLRNIELTENQRQRIINSHTYLRSQLQQFDYVRDTFLTGSYKKNTMIKPPNDVDIFVVINHSYSEITPNAVLSKLKRHLLHSYPNSTIRQDKPCIVLDFNHCKFELTPAIEINQYHYPDYYPIYYIPVQGGNDWMDVESPRILEERLTDANQGLNGMLVPLIKMMKVCKRYNNITDKKSFEMEDIVINSFGYSLGYIDSYRAGVQQLLRDYNWLDDDSIYAIENWTDPEFAIYCRTTLFGNDFPE